MANEEAFENKKMIKLMSSDGVIFQVEEAVLMEFQAVDLYGTDATIPIKNVTGEILAKVIDYCKKHVEHKLCPLPDDEINAWDKDFINLDKKTLSDLVMASDYLNVKDLTNLACQRLADMIGGKTLQEIRSIFM